MHARLLNVRHPHTAPCLLLVVVLHGLVLLWLQLQSTKEWAVKSPSLTLPSISLRLLPLALESVATLTKPPSAHSGFNATERRAAQTTASKPLEAVTSPSLATAPAPSESPSETSTQPLNLSLSKRDWTDSIERKLPGLLPTPMTPGAWQQFVKTLRPPEEIKEERLSINRVRIHTKYGCYELEQTATKRVDPFNWSPQYVTNCRY
jgi:hypothetical protein